MFLEQIEPSKRLVNVINTVSIVLSYGKAYDGTSWGDSSGFRAGCSEISISTDGLFVRL